MFFFYPIPGVVWFLIAAVLFVGSVVFAIWFNIMQAKEEYENRTVKVYTGGKRVAILFAVLAIFASIFAVFYGFANNDGIVGTIGVIAWMIASLIVAYTCSPLRLFFADSQYAGDQGCAYLLYLPLLIIVSTVSVLLIMLISWIFGLAVVLKGLSAKVYLIIAVCIAVLIGIGFAINSYQKNESLKEEKYEYQLVEQAKEQVLLDVEVGYPQKVVFDEETRLAMESYEVESFFGEAEVREAVADKLCYLNSKNKLDELIEFFGFLDVNNINLLSQKNVYDICFSDSYLKDLQYAVHSCGDFEKMDNDAAVYTYKDAEFRFGNYGCFVEFEYILNNKATPGSAMLGNVAYREEQHETYDESSDGYYLVDNTVERIESKIENSQDRANKYYPAATCPKCGTGFRENTLYARMIAEYGYCGMGLCGKD